MNILRTALAGVAGTTVMTLFSYLISQQKDKQFKEPVILSQLVKRLLPRRKRPDTNLPGWILHYMVGLMFSSVYDRIWQKTRINPSLAASIVLGGISGLAGIGIWKKTFDLHPNPPNVPLKDYFGHLLIAHLLFGLSSGLAYRAQNGNPTRRLKGQKLAEKDPLITQTELVK